MHQADEQPIYAFRGYRLDARRRILSRDSGEPVDLPHKAFEALLCFLECPGELLSKRELLEKVWPNVIVEDNNLDQTISTLRRKLGERPGENRFIATDPGKGYRFVAEVRVGMQASKPPGWRRLLHPTAVALLAVAALASLGGYLLTGVKSRSDASIAVLPFVDLSEQGDQQYLSDGFAEELMGLLAKVPALRVVARTSAFSFREKSVTVDEIARVLNVGYVVEGSVRRDASRVRVAAQLIDASTGRGIWRESYDREMLDVFAIQDDIAARIVDQLRIRLAGPVPPSDRTDNLEVHNLYMQALHINKQTGRRDSLPLARELMERAVDLDPNYFPARSMLAVSYFNLQVTGQLSGAVAEPLVRDSVETMAIDWPDRPEVLSWQALIAMEYERDYESAARLIERAISIEPGNLDALNIAARLAHELGRLQMSVEIQEYIVTRDPICVYCYQNLMSAYLRADRYDRVEDVYEKAMSLGMDNSLIRSTYGDALLLSGRPEAALAEFRAIQGARTETMRLRGSAMAFYSLGRMAEFEQAMEQLRAKTPRDLRAETDASIYAYTGDLDAAFDLLIERQDIPVSWYDGPMKVMRNHREWPALARQLGIWPEDPRDAVHFEVTLTE